MFVANASYKALLISLFRGKHFCFWWLFSASCLIILLLMQPLDVILSQDHNQIVALLEYVRYDFRPQIQQSSIKIMSILRYHLVFCSVLHSLYFCLTRFFSATFCGITFFSTMHVKKQKNFYFLFLVCKESTSKNKKGSKMFSTKRKKQKTISKNKYQLVVKRKLQQPSNCKELKS